MCAMRSFRKAPPVPSRTSTSQLPLDPLKKIPTIQQQPICSQTLNPPQRYHVTPLDLMRPVKTKAETVSLYTQWANHYMQKAGYDCVITDLQNDFRDGKMLISLTHAVVNEHVVLKEGNKSPRDIITACLKVLEDIGVEVHDVSVEGVLNGRLKCILGLFFNLSKFKQKLREGHFQAKNQISTSIPRNSTESSNTSTSLDSPESDKRYVTPPSSVQSCIQYQSRPMSDPQVLKKPLESKSRLPVFRQNRNKNCPQDLSLPKSHEITGSSPQTRSIKSPQPIKNQKINSSKLSNPIGSSGTNQSLLSIGRPATTAAKPLTSLPQPTAIQIRSFTEFRGQSHLRESNMETNRCKVIGSTNASGITSFPSPSLEKINSIPHYQKEAQIQQPISKLSAMNNVIPPPLFVRTNLQYHPATRYPGVSQFPAPTLSFNSGVLGFTRPSDFLPQGLLPTTLSNSSSVVSLTSSNSSQSHPNSSKSFTDPPEDISEAKDGEDSPFGSGEINRAMSQLEDINLGTWSGRLPPTFPGTMSSTGRLYLTTVRQRTSLDPQFHADKIVNPMNQNDGDDKSIKSECLPVKSLERTGIAPDLFSSESNIGPPDSWSNSLPNRPFREVPMPNAVEKPSAPAQLRARADGKEESFSERIYGPLGFIKLPYDHPRSLSDHPDVKSPRSLIDCVNIKHSEGQTNSVTEISHLRRELELARQKVTSLTSQLESNAR